jgi:hypothetical protein
MVDGPEIAYEPNAPNQAGRQRPKEAGMIFVAGISFKTAPVALREQLAVAPSRLIETAARLKEKGGLSEITLLCTCNRVELYGVADQAGGCHSLRLCSHRRGGGAASIFGRQRAGFDGAGGNGNHRPD